MTQKTETSTTATAAATQAPKDISNGVTRPKAGTATGRVWQICDELSAASNAPAERAQVIAKATAEGINAATVATQHGKWRKYHGLVAASPEAKAEKAKADADAKAKKDADAKAKKDADAKAKKDTAAAAKKAKKDTAAAAAAAAAGSSDVTVQTGGAA
jgi:hypothetical protein